MFSASTFSSTRLVQVTGFIRIRFTAYPFGIMVRSITLITRVSPTTTMPNDVNKKKKDYAFVCEQCSILILSNTVNEKRASEHKSGYDRIPLRVPPIFNYICHFSRFPVMSSHPVLYLVLRGLSRVFHPVLLIPLPKKKQKQLHNYGTLQLLYTTAGHSY